MNRRNLRFLGLLFLCGCETAPVPPATHRPGAELIGADLPSTQLGPMSTSDSPPIPVRMQNPVYPFELRRRGVTGVVIVEFIVGPDGKVRNARVIQSPHEELSKAAVAAILRSEYRPAINDGKPTTVTMRVPITFAL